MKWILGIGVVGFLIFTVWLREYFLRKKTAEENERHRLLREQLRSEVAELVRTAASYVEARAALLPRYTEPVFDNICGDELRRAMYGEEQERVLRRSAYDVIHEMGIIKGRASNA